MPNPRLVCSGWKNAHGRTFPCSTYVIDEGEDGGKTVMVQCEVCGKLEQSAQRRAYWQGVERVQRNSAKGYKLDPDETPWDQLKRGS